MLFRIAPVILRLHNTEEMRDKNLFSIWLATWIVGLALQQGDKGHFRHS